MTSLEITFLGSVVALIVAPIIAVLLQVRIEPDMIASVQPTAVVAFLFWALVAATLNLPAQTLLISAFNRTANPALVSALDALILVFALVPDVLWHGVPPSSLIGTKGIGLALILVGAAWAIYRDAQHTRTLPIGYGTVAGSGA